MRLTLFSRKGNFLKVTLRNDPDRIMRISRDKTICSCLVKANIFTNVLGENRGGILN